MASLSRRIRCPTLSRNPQGKPELLDETIQHSALVTHAADLEAHKIKAQWVLPSLQEGEEIRMNDTHSASCISLIHHAGDVDLARSCS